MPEISGQTIVRLEVGEAARVDPFQCLGIRALGIRMWGCRIRDKGLRIGLRVLGVRV